MTGVVISSLPAASTLTGSEIVPIVQSGTTVRTTLAAMPYVPTGTGAVTTTVQAKLRESVSVKDFGADPTGTAAVNFNAFQTALDYAHSLSSGCEIYIPEGTYSISSTLTIYPNTTLCGAGINSSVLSFTSDVIGLQSVAPINSSTAVYINIRDLKLTTSVTSTKAAYVDICGSFVNVDCISVGSFKYGIIFDQTEVSTITRCVFNGNITNGANIWLANGNYTAGANINFTNRITISQNQFNGGSSLLANIIDDGGDNHSITDNNFNGGNYGILAAGTINLVVTGNEFEVHINCDINLSDTMSNSVYIATNSAPVINGNTLQSGSGGTNLKLQSCEGGEITSNFFGQAAQAILLTNGASNKARGVVIEGNTKLLRGPYRTSGVFIAGLSGPISSQVIRQKSNTYVASSLSAGTVTVTPATNELIQIGDKLYCINDDDTNGEQVTVTAVTSTTFTATFASAKSANWIIVGIEPPLPEQGVFTPTVIGTTTAGTGTYSVQVGRYQLIGNRVYFNLTLIWSAHTGTGNMFVSGLPYTSANITNASSPCSIVSDSISMTAGNYMTGAILGNTKNISLYQTPTGGGALNLIPIDTAGGVYISGSYEV